MKHYLSALLIMMLALSNGKAQDTSMPVKQKNKKSFYLNLNSSYTNKHFIYGIGTSMALKNNWSAGIGIKWAVFHSDEVPVDYEPGLILFGGDGIPNDIYAFYSISIAKDFNRKCQRIIPGIETGLTYLENTTAKNYIPHDRGTGWFSEWSSNYDFSYEKKRGIGVLIKPKLKFVLSKNIGFETSAWTIFNKIENYYGVEVTLLIGRLN